MNQIANSAALPMDLARYNFDLPQDLVAQSPSAQRDGARLLVVRRNPGGGEKRFEEALVSDLPQVVRETPQLKNSLWIRNLSRVLPARLYARRATGGRHEIVLLEKTQVPGVWSALIRGQSHFKYPQLLRIEAPAPDDIELLSPAPGLLDLSMVANLPDWLERVGQMPVPPYIELRDEMRDRERYQSVWAEKSLTLSAAAPTASLHFTPRLVEALRSEGPCFADLALHVGRGTFEAARSHDLAQLKLHSEKIEIPESTAHLLDKAQNNKRYVLPIGTTALRAIESYVRRTSQEVTPPLPAAALEEDVNLRREASGKWAGDTSLAVLPGFEFKISNGLLTNFHLPQSTLFVLVSVFCGSLAFALEAYHYAIERKFRFYSYGDATLWV